MKKRLVLTITLILIAVTGVFAGDKAELVNLGFSPDGRYFMFGQYGYSPETSKSYAEIYLVDVEKNSFVPGGIFKGEYISFIEPGQSADGSLYTLLESVSSIREKYNVDYIQKGRPLYIRIEETEESMSALDFRDFETGSRYRMNLNQDTRMDEEGLPVESSFHIELNYSTASREDIPFMIGHPDFKRKDIGSYRIERVLTDPKGHSLVIILAKIDRDLNIRYMVETLRLK